MTIIEKMYAGEKLTKKNSKLLLGEKQKMNIK